VKIQHRVPTPGWGYVPPSHVETDERYLAELEASQRKAERAWRRAQQALERAEEKLAAKPGPDLLAAREAALREFEVRERALAEIRALMQAPAGGRRRAVHRAGRDDRLETGNKQKRRRR
jgi:hypothetical protein